MQRLGERCASKLGFEGIRLQCALSKVVVSAEARQLHKADSSGDGAVVARLMVQLQSTNSGGDIVVFGEQSTVPTRYGMGRGNRTAAFKPQYVLVAPEASCVVEEVTEGYRVMLEYTLKLPPTFPPIGCNKSKLVLAVQLADTIKKLKSEEDECMVNGDERLALVLAQSFDELELGAEALCGMDRARLQSLIDANKFLPPEKQLRFYCACLEHSVTRRDEFWDKIVAEESVSFYLLSGEELCTGRSIQWTSTFNFVNPGKQTLVELWGGRCKRWVVVAWPAASDIANTCMLMGKFAAISYILGHKSVDSTTSEDS